MVKSFGKMQSNTIVSCIVFLAVGNVSVKGLAIVSSGQDFKDLTNQILDVAQDRQNVPGKTK